MKSRVKNKVVEGGEKKGGVIKKKGVEGWDLPFNSLSLFALPSYAAHY